MILIMCTGNVCRSPMAEALMRHRLTELGIGARVISRGFGAPSGREPHPFAVNTALEFGVPIARDKRAAQLNPVDLSAATVVLVMDAGHRHQAQQRYPAAGGKTFLLRHWLDGRDIPDPIHEPEEVFRQQWSLIDEGCTSWIQHLRKAGMLPPAADNSVSPP